MPGYQYSKVQEWQVHHAFNGWIDDPASNFRYEAHHYWDASEDSSFAANAYADALAVSTRIV